MATSPREDLSDKYAVPFTYTIPLAEDKLRFKHGAGMAEALEMFTTWRVLEEELLAT